MVRESPELESVMTARRTRLLLTGLLGLLVALAASTAPGAIVPTTAVEPLDGPETGLARQYVTQFLDRQAPLDGLTGPAPISRDPSPERDGPPTLQEVEDLLAALPAGCQPSSISQSSGSGSANPAIRSTVCDMPELALAGSLLKEIRPTFVNPLLLGPLRPPRL